LVAGTHLVLIDFKVYQLLYRFWECLFLRIMEVLLNVIKLSTLKRNAN